MSIKDMFDLYPFKKVGGPRITYTCKIIDFNPKGKWTDFILLEMHFKQNIEHSDKMEKIWDGIKCNCLEGQIRKKVKQRNHKISCLKKNLPDETKNEIKKDLKEIYHGVENEFGHWEFDDPWTQGEPFCQDYDPRGKFIQLEFDGVNWEVVKIKQNKRCVFE